MFQGAGSGASVDMAFPQPTGTTFSLGQHEPPRLMNFGSGNASRVGSGTWGGGGAPPSIGAPHMTGGTGFSTGTHLFPSASHYTGGTYNTSGGGGPIPISQDPRLVPGSSPMPGQPSIHMTGISGMTGSGRLAPTAMSPMPTGVTGLSANTMPASAAAMAGASSVHGGRTRTSPQPTGATTAMSLYSVRTHQTGTVPGGFKTSTAPHNTGAGSAFNFQNLPPPKNAFGEEIEVPGAGGEPSDAAGFVGAPTRVGSPTPGIPLPIGTDPASPGVAAGPNDAPASPSKAQPTHPMSKTMQYAAELSSRELAAASKNGKTLSDATIAESRGAALVDANRAFWGTHRPASRRFIWSLPLDHDERVASLMDWITRMQWALAKHGMRKFLDTRKRGALMVNAGYISPYHPNEPVFDWLTFDRAQSTGDRILQESIATYDPATTTIVVVFLISESYSSAAMWRRMLTLPPSTQLAMSIPIERLKAELRKTTNVIHIQSPALWTSPGTPTSSTPSSPRSIATPKPIIQKEVIREIVQVLPAEKKEEEPKKKKKPKWWQFWKRINITWGDS